jgi:hypothetical protein
MKRLRVLVFLTLLLPALAAEKSAPPPATSPVAMAGLRWLSFPDPELELRGLPWFKDNAPELWRFPKQAKAEIPGGVWNRAIAPDGGRIRFTSTTGRLVIRVQAPRSPGKVCFFDAYADDTYLGSARLTGTEVRDLVLFEGKDSTPRNLTIYLPNNGEVRVLAVGVDAGAALKRPPAFAAKAPIVCYGSSVLQGTGAQHPAKTYPAAVARRLNLDFVNLGFGGAGKAEPAVVALVNQLDASCFLFDLGKSYGNQDKEAFVRMLATIRAAHPKVPLICVTPIYSTNEPKDAAYLEKSVRLRNMMRDAANERRAAGDQDTYVVEGLDLFGEGDKQLFHDPQHPNDEGNELIGQRLVALVQKVVLGKQDSSR